MSVSQYEKILASDYSGVTQYSTLSFANPPSGYEIKSGVSRYDIIHAGDLVTYSKYSFYNSSYNQISDISISGLANAYYYTKDGSSYQRVGGRIFYINSGASKGTDKFYVYDSANGLATNKYWGWYMTQIGATGNSIGSGKTNTAKVLAKGIPTDYTPNIWRYITDINTANTGGCNDWFIGSRAELEQLKNSNLVDWFSSNDIWTSVEYQYWGMYAYAYAYESFSYMDEKDSTYCVCAFRAF